MSVDEFSGLAFTGREFAGTGFDALIYLSFGGPEKSDDVIPFLENVTRGRGVPSERLEQVAKQYYHFGGVSPINSLNRAIIEQLKVELAQRNWNLPVYFGNRNWQPFLIDTLRQAYNDGHRRIAVFTTSAWGGYSGCRQYDEDIAKALASLGKSDVILVKLPHFFDHPIFIESSITSIREGFSQLPRELQSKAQLIFTAHSIPVSADNVAGPPSAGGNLYSKQISEASAKVAAALGIVDFKVVWQSRSGPPQVPWLGPDIVDHIAMLTTPAVVVYPIGFISDHLEVLWDLDTAAAEVAAKSGITFVRAGTVGTTENFSTLICELIKEAAESSNPLRGNTINGKPCAEGCCAA